MQSAKAIIENILRYFKIFKEINKSCKENNNVLHLIPKWRKINYSFVSMLIGLVASF